MSRPDEIDDGETDRHGEDERTMRMTSDVRIKPVLYAAIIVVTASWVFTGCNRSNLPLGVAGSTSGHGTMEGYIYAPPILPNGEDNAITEVLAGLISFQHLNSGKYYETVIVSVASDPSIPDHPSASDPFDRSRLGYFRMSVPPGFYDDPEKYLEFISNGTQGIQYVGPQVPFPVYEDDTVQATTIRAYQQPDQALD